MESVTFEGWRGFTGKGLAERELESLLAIAAGRTDKEAAREMGIAPRTVKGAVERCMNKLQAFRRAQLVAEALRRGIIAPACVAFLAILLVGQHQQSTTLTRRPEGPRRIELRVTARRDACAWVA